MNATSMVSSAAITKAFYSIAELAEEIGSTTRFIEKRIEDGELRVFRPSSRLIRISGAEKNRWIESYSSGGGDAA